MVIVLFGTEALAFLVVTFLLPVPVVDALVAFIGETERLLDFTEAAGTEGSSGGGSCKMGAAGLVSLEMPSTGSGTGAVGAAGAASLTGAASLAGTGADSLSFSFGGADSFGTAVVAFLTILIVPPADAFFFGDTDRVGLFTLGADGAITGFRTGGV